MEPTSLTPEPSFWSTIELVVTDLLTQQIPASVVLLIIACILGPLAFRTHEVLTWNRPPSLLHRS